MKTIKINVQDDLIALYGLEAIKKSLEEELAYQRFKLLEKHITESMAETGVEWDD
jgi:restriction endonuclease S subunit